jgi:hypothetical protein
MRTDEKMSEAQIAIAFDVSLLALGCLLGYMYSRIVKAGSRGEQEYDPY